MLADQRLQSMVVGKAVCTINSYIVARHLVILEGTAYNGCILRTSELVTDGEAILRDPRDEAL